VYRPKEYVEQFGVNFFWLTFRAIAEFPVLITLSIFLAVVCGGIVRTMSKFNESQEKLFGKENT
jgi:hypothetical protein